MPEGVDDEERRDNRAGSGSSRIRASDFVGGFLGAFQWPPGENAAREAKRREWAIYLPRGTLVVLS
jgi:hypothetical protein